MSQNTANQRFTVIIPFRNEAKNLSALAKSLEQLNYSNSHFEVFWINDHSTDESTAILAPFLVNNTNWKLLDTIRKSNSPKKDALQTAIQLANYQWIITTDADCEVPENWLQCYNDFILSFQEKGNLKLIAAPVAYKTNGSFLQNFQNMDFLSLIGTTIGSFGVNKSFMCNGANLCYQKEVFLAVNGFSGNDTIASGDDVFLMEKIMNKYRNSVHYLKSKDALVVTKPETTFKGLISQRIRWASKTAATNNWFGKFVGFIVFLFNFCLVLGLVLKFRDWVLVFFTEVHVSEVFLSPRFFEVLLVAFLLKFNIDFLLIQKTYRFVGLNNGLKSYIFSSVLYPFFVVLVVLLSLFKKVEWKDRVFDK